MTPTILIAICGLACLGWLSRHYQLWRQTGDVPTLTGVEAGPPANAPLLSVMVAAKDEEENIETCVRSMLSQDYPNFEMIVCNDRSGDRTAEIVERIAREDSRLRLINITQLPDGWAGKCNAMQTGIASAHGQWICMIDADCRQRSTRTLSVAMQYAIDNNVDLLSGLPGNDTRSFWEHVVQPVGSGVMMIWFRPDRVNNPAPPTAYANGAFMLMKRSAYDAIGSHASVRDCLNEDMNMALRVKRAGLRLRVALFDKLYGVRMYNSFKGLARGWSRIFLGTFGTMRRLSISLAVMLFMGILPYIAAALGLALAGVSGLWLACGLVGAAAVALQISVAVRWYKVCGCPAALGFFYGLGCAVMTWSLLSAIGKLRPGAKVVWRGTVYSTPGT